MRSLAKQMVGTSAFVSKLILHFKQLRSQDCMTGRRAAAAHLSLHRSQPVLGPLGVEEGMVGDRARSPQNRGVRQQGVLWNV